MKSSFKLLISILLIFTVVFGGMTFSTYAASQTGTVTASSLIVRKGPGTSYSQVLTLSSGTKVTILGTSGNWCEISYSGKKGYVSKNYLKISGTTQTSSSSSAETLRRGSNGSQVVTLQNNLKKLGYFNASSTGTYGPATETAVKDFQKANGLKADGIAGSSTLSKINSSVSKSSTKTSTKTTTIVSGKTNIVLRIGAGGKDVTDLQKALNALGYLDVSPTGNFGSMTRTAVKEFQKDNGIKVDGVAGPQTLKALYNSGGKVALSVSKDSSGSYETLRPGNESTSVKNMQLKLQELGFFDNEATGLYGSITTKAVIDFQNSIGLEADGIAGPKTLEKLFDGEEITYDKNNNVELSDWFSEMAKVFGKGETATVTDVKTKISFKIRRYGGTNHADVEPATAADTKKMKQIFDGSWSWHRRAIWIDIDDRCFAASMNGMPHGGEALSYNNFGGHFCVHTLHSRTHGTDRVDSDHQDAARYAFEHADQR